MAKSGATTLQQSLLLGRDFGSEAYTQPSVWYIALSTTIINEDGTNATEPTDPSYARIAVDNNISSWESLLSGTGRQNASIIEFAPATVNQGTIVCIGLYDSLTGGDVRYYSELINPKVVGVDDVLRIDASNLQIRLQPTT